MRGQTDTGFAFTDRFAGQQGLSLPVSKTGASAHPTQAHSPRYIQSKAPGPSAVRRKNQKPFIISSLLCSGTALPARERSGQPAVQPELLRQEGSMYRTPRRNLLRPSSPKQRKDSCAKNARHALRMFRDRVNEIRIHRLIRPASSYLSRCARPGRSTRCGIAGPGPSETLQIQHGGDKQPVKITTKRERKKTLRRTFNRTGPEKLKNPAAEHPGTHLKEMGTATGIRTPP